MRNGCRSPNLHAELSSCRGNSLGNRAHATHHVAVKTLHIMRAAAEQVEQEPDRSAWLIRSAMLPVHVICEKHRLDCVGFIIAVEKLAEASREEGNELCDFRTRDLSEALAHPHQVGPASCAFERQPPGAAREKTAADSEPTF